MRAATVSRRIREKRKQSLVFFCYPKDSVGPRSREYPLPSLRKHVTMMKNLYLSLYPLLENAPSSSGSCPNRGWFKTCLLSPRCLGVSQPSFSMCSSFPWGIPFHTDPSHWRLFSNGDLLQWAPIFSMRKNSLFFKGDLHPASLKGGL